VNILCLAFSSVTGDLNSKLIPVSTAATVILSIVLIATSWASTSQIVEVVEVILWCWESIGTVEWGTIVLLDSAYLIGSPETDLVTTSLLEEVLMARVKTDTAFASTTVTVVVAAISTSSYLDIIVGRRVEIP
jgi:hypothetical protein